MRISFLLKRKFLHEWVLVTCARLHAQWHLLDPRSLDTLWILVFLFIILQIILLSDKTASTAMLQGLLLLLLLLGLLLLLLGRRDQGLLDPTRGLIYWVKRKLNHSNKLLKRTAHSEDSNEDCSAVELDYSRTGFINLKIYLTFFSNYINSCLIKLNYYDLNDSNPLLILVCVCLADLGCVTWTFCC